MKLVENLGADPMITVLFVDDEPAMLRAVVRSLRGAPFQVLAAESAAEALRIMSVRSVDVLVSDIDMPGMSGSELVALVRDEFPSTLRMLLTGAATLAGALQAINEGEVHRLFNKPLDFDLFRATMAGLRERIEKLRRDGEQGARAARWDAYQSRVEDQFPGTLDVDRDDDGVVVIDALGEDFELLQPAPG